MPRYFFDVKNDHRLFDASGFVCEDDTDAIIRATVLFIWQSKASLWIFIWMTQRYLARLGQFDHAHRRRVAALSTGPAF
jgi:hypothetical protein